MENRIFSLAVLLAICVSAGCGGGAAPQAGPEPQDTAPARWDASSDPDQIAAWALRRCRGVLVDRRVCVERSLGDVTRTAGVGKAMAALDRIAERDARLLPDAHGLAHGLGIAAYRGPETVAEDFAACPPTQISGCHHGIVQGYFLDMSRRHGDVDQARLNTLCEPHRSSAVLFFQCTHGMGHGLMSMFANHLPASLEKCDLVADPVARENCYGGAFMENIVAAAHPEHTAHSHAEVGGKTDGGHAEHGDGHAAQGGEHAGHGDAHAGHGAQAAREPWKALDRQDPLYPCTAVEQKYRSQCYLIQTGAILFHNRGNFAAAASACSRAPAEFVSTCWRSLGRDITAYAGRHPGRTANLCARSGRAAELDCIHGAAETLVNTSTEPEDGFAFCRVLEGAEKKTACYGAVGGTLRAIYNDPAPRETRCAGVEAGYVEACRRQAGLPARQASES